MPTRTQTSHRPAGGRFGRPAGKPAQRPARGQRTTSSRRPAMPTVRRRPKQSGAAKAVERLSGLLPRKKGQKRGASGGPGKKGQKRGASGGPGKKGTAGLALLAGAAGLLMKNREKLTAMIRHRDSSGQPGQPVKPVEPQAGPVASNSGPVAPAPVPNPPASPDHPAA